MQSVGEFGFLHVPLLIQTHLRGKMMAGRGKKRWKTRGKAMCLGVSYSRWSHPDQSAGDSRRRQEKAFQDFCKAHNLTPSPRTFVDDGVPAWKSKNWEGQLGAFLKAAPSYPPGTVLVVEQLDRLSRDDVDIAVGLIGKIIRSGVNIGHVRSNKILTRASLKGIAILEVVVELILANEESNKKSERCGDAWGAKVANADKEIVSAVYMSAPFGTVHFLSGQVQG